MAQKKISQKKLVVANWKMNPETTQAARQLAIQSEHGLFAIAHSKISLVVCPPFPYLSLAGSAFHFSYLGAQDIAPETESALTGGISGAMLSELGVKYVLVGHSERRALGEGERLIKQKLKACFTAGLKPILCVGYGISRNAKKALIKRIVARQIRSATAGLRFAQSNLTVAYEPVWAVSPGGPATPEHAAEITWFIKSFLPKIRVLYGGSIDDQNAQGFAEQEDINGGLVGAACLDVHKLISILKAYTKNL